MTDPVDPGFSILTEGINPDVTHGAPAGAMHLPHGMPPLEPGQLSLGGATVYAEPGEPPAEPTFTPPVVPEEHLLDAVYLEPEEPPSA